MKDTKPNLSVVNSVSDKLDDLGPNEAPKLSREELKNILAAIGEAYAAHGLAIETAMLVEDVTEDNEMVGEILIDNRKKEKLQ